MSELTTGKKELDDRDFMTLEGLLRVTKANLEKERALTGHDPIDYYIRVRTHELLQMSLESFIERERG